jgi:MYXO-CTERM domain-containing protein
MKRCITLLLMSALGCSAESGQHEQADLGFSQQPISVMSRDAIIARAKTGVGYSYWWAHGAWRLDGTQHGSCSGGCPSCSHSGSYGADCSGFVAKVWQVPNDIAVDDDAHPYSTYHFKNQSNQWSSISRSDVQKGDALVYNTNGAGHIFLFESGDPWGSMWAYECAGCATGCVHNIRTAGSSYSAIRRDSIGGPTSPGGGGSVRGDVNGDGRSDLVSVNADGNAYVWTGQTDGKFGGNAVPSFDGTLDSANLDGTGHLILAVVDVTGDGRSDLVSASTDGSAYVWPGLADGKFGGAVASFDGTLDSANLDGGGHYLVGVSDVNGDGHADLVSVNADGNAWVWPGTASGGFGGAVPSFDGTLDSANLDGTGHFIVGVADVTGDGKSDLVAVNADGNAYVWPGGSDGKFGTAVPSFDGTLDSVNLDGAGHLIVGVSDVTGDGKADLVSVNSGDGNAWVWSGGADGTFSGAVASFEGTLNISNLDGTGHFIVGVADTTGDGKSDLVSMNEDGSAYVWPGAQDATFGSAVGSFDGTMNSANLDGNGHYIVAPLGPEWMSPTSGSAGGPPGSGGHAGGRSGQGGSGWSGSSGMGGSPGADPKKTSANEGSCACRTTGKGGETPWALLFLAALGLWRFRARCE